MAESDLAPGLRESVSATSHPHSCSPLPPLPHPSPSHEKAILHGSLLPLTPESSYCYSILPLFPLILDQNASSSCPEKIHMVKSAILGASLSQPKSSLEPKDRTSPPCSPRLAAPDRSGGNAPGSGFQVTVWMKVLLILTSPAEQCIQTGHHYPVAETLQWLVGSLGPGQYLVLPGGQQQGLWVPWSTYWGTGRRSHLTLPEELLTESPC